MSDFYEYERKFAEMGILMAGADEAGRGPLAGPVVAAAVIMPEGSRIEGVADSKKLTEKKRELLYEQITKSAVSWAVGIVDVDVIEEINILNAARLAFKKAVEALLPKPDRLLADYITGLDIDVPYTAIVKGDATVYSIAAASIIAKVTRDRIMRKLDEEYPVYGFKKHKGYGTKQHICAIIENGPSKVHRMSFLKKILEKGN